MLGTGSGLLSRVLFLWSATFCRAGLVHSELTLDEFREEESSVRFALMLILTSLLTASYDKQPNLLSGFQK